MLLADAVLNLWPGNWDQFISGLVATVIGTLIGIFGPFYLQSLHERKNKGKKAMQYLHDIQDELFGIRKQFGGIKESDIYLSPIKTPVWDSLINTNEIQLLSILHHKGGNGSNVVSISRQLFQVYDLIKEYNLWWNMYTQGAVVGARTESDLNSIKTFINQSKNKLLCQDKGDVNYQESINYTLDLIESYFNS